MMASPAQQYKGAPEKLKFHRLRADVLCTTMRMNSDRAVLTVQRQAGLWVVEYGGEHFGHSPDKEIAKAAAHKRARQMQDGGRACQVQVRGDVGYFSGVR
jgi:hypothetical protein